MHLCSKSVEICKWLVKRKSVNLSTNTGFKSFFETRASFSGHALKSAIIVSMDVKKDRAFPLIFSGFS